MSDRIDDLERKAKAATPGPWSADGYGNGQQVTGATGTVFADTLAFHEDAEFIAAANPAAILRLIGELRRWKAAWEMASPLLTERDALAAKVAAVEALADRWRHCGDPGDPRRKAASALRAALSEGDDKSAHINDTSIGRCRAALTVKGETFRCDLATEHDGWAHSSQTAEAIWDGGESR